LLHPLQQFIIHYHNRKSNTAVTVITVDTIIVAIVV